LTGCGATHAQVRFVADGGKGTLGAGVCVWLMRGCGLRIEEALAVEKKDFCDNGTILRVCRQATRDGRDAVPLKKRKRHVPNRVGCSACQRNRARA
jgi:hypothetical protein